MPILVTGAAGRIGSAAIDRLLANGRTVRGLDRRASGRSAPGYEEVLFDLGRSAIGRSVMEGVDAVVHLGAFMSWAPADRDAMVACNVEGTRTLLDAANEAGVRRFVFASSGEVYPENAPDHLPIAEDHPLRPQSPYGLTKLLGEELVRFHQRRGPMETVILRFSHTQSADELLDEDSFFSGPRFFLQPRIRQQTRLGNDGLAALLRRHDPGRPAHILSRNEAGRPFMMHITETRDMVAGLVLALEHPAAAGETFNLGATEPVDFGLLVPAMAEITGYPVVPVDLPGTDVYYRTANDRIRNRLGFSPQWTIDRMLQDAAAARKARRTG